MFDFRSKILLAGGICLPLLIWSARIHSQAPTEWDNLIEQFLSADSDEKLSKAHYSMPSGVYDGRQLYQFQLGEEWEPSPHTGYTNKKNGKVRQIKKFADEILYDATYTFDEFHRRINLIPRSEKHQRFVALFGGSFAYGNVVNDDETIHHYMNKYSNDIYTYNYSIGASGPHMMLALLRNTDLKKQIQMESGHFIYIYVDFHIERANGFLHERGWLKDTPVYAKKDGNMVRLGTFAEVEPLWTGFLDFLRGIFEKYGIPRNFPKRKPSHFIYVCDLLNSSKNEFVRKFPRGKFSVYIHPSSYLESPLRDCLNKNRVHILDVNGDIAKDSESLLVPYDGHPSARFNERIARDLLERVQ